MKVGCCTVIAVLEMQVMTYVLATYELALAQAEELLKGCNFERISEELNKDNGMRMTHFKVPEHFELIQVHEVEVGTEVAKVD